MGIGTFGSFTQARLAIYAAQAAITVTGNNVANVNTTGYTRQRLDQSSLYIGGTDRYYSASNLHIGAGVMCDGVSQIRDKYLDIRYRDQNAAVGNQDGWLAGLENIQQILDEVGDGEITEGEDFGLISAYLEKMGEALDGLTDWTGQQDYDIQVRTAAEELVRVMNSYASQLQELHARKAQELDEHLGTVNGLLTDIRNLNEQIRTAEIYGDNALELRDARNLKLDQLSNFMKIDVSYSMEHIGAGQEIEKMTLKLGNANPDITVDTDETILIDGIYGGQISILPKMNPAYVDDTTTPNTPKYLDAQGQPTDEILSAAHNDNYNMQVSELRNSRGQLLYYMDNQPNEILTPADIDAGGQLLDIDGNPITLNPDGSLPKTSETKTDPATGITTIRTYSSTFTYKKNDDYDPDDPDSLPYLDANGQPTGDKAQAAREYTYYAQSYTRTPSKEVDLDDNDLTGKIQAYRELLTEAGEFTPTTVINGGQGLSSDENAGTKRGIPYYMKSLDLLAHQFATVMNNANQGYYTDQDGNLITQVYDPDADTSLFPDGMVGVPLSQVYPGYTLNKSMLIGGTEWDMTKVPQAMIDDGYDTSEKINEFLNNQTHDITDANGNTVTVKNGIFRGGPLFSNHGDTDNTGNPDDPLDPTDPEITASNISISASWAAGPMIVNSYTCPPGMLEPASTDSINILENILGPLRYDKMDFYPDGVFAEKANGASHNVMFHGTFLDMWVNTGTVLGNDMKITSSDLDAHYKTALQIDTSRDSVSGVDFNDEAANLIMYSKAYNAACRVMTTLDSVLDKLINGTGVT